MSFGNWLWPRFFVVDAALLFFATFIALLLRMNHMVDWGSWQIEVQNFGGTQIVTWGQVLSMVAVYLFPALVSVAVGGRRIHDPPQILSQSARLVLLLILANGISAVIYVLIRPPNFPLSFIALASGFSLSLVAIARVAIYFGVARKLPGAIFPTWLSNTGLLVAGCLGGLIALEIVLRIYNPIEFRVRGSEIVLPTSVHIVYTNNNPIEGRTDRQIVVKRNKLGFRGPDAPPDFDDWLTIVTVGGSTTEDVSLSEGKTWTNRLFENLQPKFTKLWVNNAGFIGHSSHAHIQLMQRFISELKPDVVIFLVGINDMGRDQMPGLITPYDENLTVHRRTVRPFFDVLADHSEVGSLLYNLDRALRAWLLGFSHVTVDRVGVGQSFDPISADGGANAQEGLLDRFDAFQSLYKERLRILIDEARKQGITPVLVTQPFLWGDAIDPTTGHDLGKLEETLLGEPTSSLVYWKALEKYNATMRSVAKTSVVTLVDLARTLPKDSFLYVDRMHFSNAGAAKVGKIIANALCAKLQRKFPERIDRFGGNCDGARKE